MHTLGAKRPAARGTDLGRGVDHERDLARGLVRARSSGLLLIADLGSPSRAYLAGMKPVTSWIARGTWIIAIFMVVSLLHLILRLHQYR